MRQMARAPAFGMRLLPSPGRSRMVPQVQMGRTAHHSRASSAEHNAGFCTTVYDQDTQHLGRGSQEFRMVIQYAKLSNDERRES